VLRWKVEGLGSQIKTTGQSEPTNGEGNPDQANREQGTRKALLSANCHRDEPHSLFIGLGKA